MAHYMGELIWWPMLEMAHDINQVNIIFDI